MGSQSSPLQSGYQKKVREGGEAEVGFTSRLLGPPLGCWGWAAGFTKLVLGNAVTYHADFSRWGILTIDLINKQPAGSIKMLFCISITAH